MDAEHFDVKTQCKEKKEEEEEEAETNLIDLVNNIKFGPIRCS